MSGIFIQERDTDGTSDAGVPGIVPAMCLLELVLYVAASSAGTTKVAKMMEYYIWGSNGARCSDRE